MPLADLILPNKGQHSTEQEFLQQLAELKCILVELVELGLRGELAGVRYEELEAEPMMVEIKKTGLVQRGRIDSGSIEKLLEVAGGVAIG